MGILDWIRDAVNSLNNTVFNQNQQNNQQTTNNQQITIRKPSGATNTYNQQITIRKPSGATNTYTPGTQNTPTQQTVTTQAPQMTPYQMNLQIPTQNQPQQWNLRTLLGTAYHIGQSGQTEEASNLFNLIQQAQLDPTTPIYNPYSQATNKSVAMLQQMGIDTSNMNDNWFNSLSWLTQYYRTGAASNTPQAPTKKSSKEEIAAYHYYQVMKAEGTTRQAEQEQAALRQELFYWAANRERNYSDEQILDRIDWSKYKTLAAMRESISNGQGVAMELNRAVDCTDDWLYSELWAARNNGGTGNSYSDMIMSALGQGNSYQENKDISAKLDITNKDTYSPYSVGMTLEEEGVYFGRTYFDQAWIENNRHYLASNDETAKKMYQNVVNAELKTQELETSLTAMNKQIDALIDRNRSADDIIRAITGNTDYNNLFALNKTFDNGELEATTRRLDYRWQDIEQKIRERCEARDKRVGAAGVADNVTNIAAGAQQKQTLPGEPTEQKPEQIPTAEPTKPGIEQLPVTVPTDGSLMTPTDLGPAEEEENGQPGQPGQPAPLRSDVEEEYQRLWENRGGNKSVLAESEQAQEAQFQQGASDIRPTLQDKGTSAEQTVSLTGNTNFWGVLTDSLKAISGNLTQPLHGLQNDILKGNYLDASRTISDYVGHREKRNGFQQNLESTQAEWDELEELDAESVAVGGMTAEQYQVMMNLDTSNPEVQDVLTELAGGEPEGWETATPTDEGYDYKNALARFYQMIVGVEGTSLAEATPEEVAARLEKAQLWYNYLTGDKWDANNPDSPINQMIEEADSQNEEEPEEYVSYVDEDSGLEILLKKGRDGFYVFDGANDAETGEQVFTADQQREVEERMGFSSGSEMPALMTNEQRARFNQLKGQRQNWEDQMRVEDDYLSMNEEIYNSAVADREFMRKQYAMSAAIADALGDGTESVNLSLLDQAYKYSQIDMGSPWTSNLIFDTAVSEGTATREEAVQAAGSTATYNLQEAKELRSMLAQMDKAGIQFTDEERATLLRNIEFLERDAKNASYCVLDGAADFAEVAAAGAAKAESGEYGRLAKAIATGEYNFEIGDLFSGLSPVTANAATRQKSIITETIQAMHQEEKDRFFYLYEKEGEKAALEYWNMLTDDQYGILTVRRSEEVQAQMQQFGREHGIAATMLSFFTNVMGGAEAVIYEAGQAISGQDVGVHSAYYDGQTATGALRGGARESFTNLFGGNDTVGGIIAGMLYDAFTSAVDSRINASMVDGIFSAATDILGKSKLFSSIGSFAEKAINGEYGSLAKFGVKATKDFLHAGSMGLNAAASTYREALMANGGKDNVQALKMATATFFAETLSEAITVGNIHEAIAAGGDEATRSLGNFMKELFKNGAEEFLGEGANEWIEANADRVIMGELSDYEQNVQEYMDNGLPETVARQMADQQMWKNILVAGAVGFISSGIGTTADYTRGALMEKAASKAGGTVTIEEPGQQPSQQEQTAQQGQEQTVQTEQTAESTPATESGNAAAGALAEMNANPAQALTGMTEDRQALLRGMQKDMLLLSSANEADSTGAAVAIASVLNTGDDFADRTVAQEMVANIAENDPKMAARILQGILNHTMEVEHPETLKSDVAMATLTRGKANTALEVIHSRIMNNQEVVAADVQELQRALADDMATDPNGMTDAYNRAVRENWIANRTQEIMIENGGAEQIRAAQDKVDDAQRGLAQAQDGLEEAQGTLEATAGNLQGVEANYNPAEVETAAPLQQTTNQLLGADAVVSEFEQSVENANEAVTTAKENFDKTQDDTLTAARQQATEEADQMFAEMAEQKRIAAEQQAEQERVRQEQETEAARQQTINDQRSGLTQEQSDRAKFERLAEQRGLKGTEAQKFVEDIMNYANDKRMNRIDLSKQLSESDGWLMMGKLARRFGTNVVIGEMANGENGSYDAETNTIRLNRNLTGGQLMVEFALHELTHSLEQTGSYQQYHDTVLEALYASEAELNDAIATKMAQYDANGHKIDEAQAKREIVADFTRTRLNDVDVINRMVNAGIGGKVRNALHNVNQFLKNRKLTGQAKIDAENLRRAERSFQKAINERARADRNEVHSFLNEGSTEETSTEYSVPNGTLTEAEMESILQSLTEGKSSQQIGESAATMIDQIGATRKNLAKKVRELRAMAEDESVKANLARINKNDLRTVSNELYNQTGSRMSRAELESRLSEIALKNEAGVSPEALLEDARSLANDLVAKMPAEKNPTLESLRGMKITIGPGAQAEIKGTNSSLAELRKKLKGTGITLAYGDTSTLDTNGEELRERFPDMPDLGNDREQIFRFVDWVEQLKAGEVNPDAGRINTDDMAVSIMAMAQSMIGINKNTSSEGRASARRAKQLNDIADSLEGASGELGDTAKEARNVRKTGEAMQGDVQKTIDYLQQRAEVAAEESQQQEEEQIAAALDKQASEAESMSNEEMDNALIESGSMTFDEIEADNAMMAAPETASETATEETLPGTQIGAGKQRQFGRYRAQESDALHQETKDWLYNHSTYTPDSNGAQIDRAVGWVQQHSTENDPTGYHAAVAEALSDDFNSMSADGQARMLILMSRAAIQDDTATERLLADAFNRQGTKAGQTLQARKIFRLMTPLGRQSILQGQVDQINNDLRNQGKEGNVELSYWIMEAASAAQTEEEFDRVRDAANKDIAGQLPVTWKDRLQTWRMTSMLANPRTHVRNFIGNALFVPVVEIKNALGTAMEKTFIKEGEQTKSIIHSQEAKAFAKQDAQAMKDTLTGEAKYSPENKVQREKKAFGTGNGLLSRTLGRAVQGLADFNSNMLEKEDWIFLNRHYQNALASYMTANNLTAADMTGSTLDKARTYAVLEAQKATYRDANAVSDWLNKMSSRGGVGGFLVDAILPFKKTPANILRRGVEYSPVGLIKSIATAKQSLDKYAAWEANGMEGNMPKGAKNANQVIDEIAAGLTGTGIAAIGALLYSMGAVKIGLDDDDSELEKLNGSQEYSLELFGHSVTLDWAAPACMPFFTGASLYKTLSEQINNGGGVDIGAFVDSLSGIAEPVFNLSMLDGVNSLLKSTSYSSNNGKVPVWQLGKKVIANYATSLVPSVSGAIARTVDTTRRKSFVESGASMSLERMALEQVENKIPFLSMRNIPYRNVWGEAETSSWGEAFLENFILPGYHTEMKEDKLVSELQRVFDATGDNAVIPKAASKTVGGEKLNDQQYDEYVVTRGQLAKSLLTELVERPEFIALTENNPEAQVQLIKNVYEYCNAAARYETLHTGTMDGWIAKAYASGNVIDTLFEREEEKAKTAAIKEYKQAVFDGITTGNAEEISTNVEGWKQAGKTDSQIRSELTKYFKPLYIQAYQDDDITTKTRIEDGLMFVDLGKSKYTFEDFSNWLK